MGGVRNFQQSRLERSHAVSTQAELHADGRRAVDGGSADPSSWDRDGLFELEGSWGGEGAGRDEEGEEEEGAADVDEEDGWGELFELVVGGMRSPLKQPLVSHKAAAESGILRLG